MENKTKIRVKIIDVDYPNIINEFEITTDVYFNYLKSKPQHEKIISVDYI